MRFTSVISSGGRCGAEPTEACSSWDRFFGTVRARARDRRHPKVPAWVEIFRGRPRYPKAPVRLADGVTSHLAGQESRSPGHRTARSVTVMCITAKPQGDKACKRT